MTRKKDRWDAKRGSVLAACIMIMLACGFGLALPRVRLNGAMLAHLPELIETVPRTSVGSYPLFDSDTSSLGKSSGVKLQQGLSPAIRWTMLRLFLLEGDYAKAESIGSTLPESFLDTNALARFDALLPKAVISPETAEKLLTQLANQGITIPPRIANSIAVAVLQTISGRATNTGVSDTDLSHLRVLLGLRSNDLYGLVAMRTVLGNSPEGMEIEAKLRKYTKDGLLPEDPRLVPFVYEAISQLHKQNLWGTKETTIAVDTLLRRCVQPSLAAEMIDNLERQSPAYSGWANLRVRLKDCNTEVRGGEVSTSSRVDSTDLAIVDTTAALRDMVPSLDLSTLGPNIMKNGDFSEYSLPKMYPTWWQWACPQFVQGEDALFIGSTYLSETRSKKSGVNIVGLWRDAEKPGVCGYYQADEYASALRPLDLEPNTMYLMSLDYNTELLEEKESGIYLAGQADVFFTGALPLNITDGCWNRVYLLGANPTQVTQKLDLLLYNGGNQGGLGRVEFDNVRMQSAGSIPVGWQAGHYVFRQIPLCG